MTHLLVTRKYISPWIDPPQIDPLRINPPKIDPPQIDRPRIDTPQIDHLRFIPDLKYLNLTLTEPSQT